METVPSVNASYPVVCLFVCANLEAFVPILARSAQALEILSLNSYHHPFMLNS